LSAHFILCLSIDIFEMVQHDVVLAAIEAPLYRFSWNAPENKWLGLIICEPTREIWYQTTIAWQWWHRLPVLQTAVFAVGKDRPNSTAATQDILGKAKSL